MDGRFGPTDSDRQIERAINEARLEGDPELILELIRADIDRRYAAGGDVSLHEYLHRFPAIAAAHDRIAAICFEDFRARRRRGRVCRSSRWAEFPGIESQSWFQALLVDPPADDSSSMFLAGDSESPEAPASISGNERATEKTALVWDQLGDFELVAMLGQGAFSKVYLARQRSLGRRYVALKVVDRPLREASHLARLQHTGIVPLYSCHRADGKWLLCMPYSGSATLEQWLQGQQQPGSRTGQSLIETVRAAQLRITETGLAERAEHDVSNVASGVSVAAARKTLQEWHTAATQPLHELADLNPRQFALWMFRKLASALAHAHQRGIVHGDLKPANILIRNDGEPALIDFNLSQDADRGPQIWIGGTLPYMSREQLSNLTIQKPVPAQPESDVYSLGMVLFEVIEGRLPFDGPSSPAEADLAVAINNRLRKPVFNQHSSASEGLRTIVRKCLKPDPADRYPTAVELLEDLELESAHLPLRYARESWAKCRLPKLTRRYPRLFSAGSIAAVSMVLVIMLLTGLFRYQTRAERLAAIESVKEFQQVTDRAFAGFLLADTAAKGEVASQGEDLVEQSLQALQIRSSGRSVRTAQQDWNGLKQHLSVEELRQVEERLLALTFVIAHSGNRVTSVNAQHTTGRTERTASAENTSVRQATFTVPNDAGVTVLLSLLPEWARNSRAGRITSSISPAYGALPAEKVLTGVSEGSTRAVPEISSARAGELVQSADRVLYATGLLLQHHPDQALEILDSTEVPDSLRLIYWMTKGRAQLEMNESRKAADAFSMALRDAQQSPSVFLNRGLAYLRLGSFEEAEQDFTEAIRLNPRLVAGYVNRHSSLLLHGDTAGALQDLDRAIELQPKSSRLRLIRSRVLRQAGRLKAAQADFDYALQHRPVNADDWVAVALARLQTDPQRALADLQTAETLFGANTTILQSMAHVLSEVLHQPEQAILTLDRLLLIEPGFQKALAGRAVLHARSGNSELAAADIRMIESLSTPPTPESLCQMACASALCCPKQPELQQTALQYLAQAVQRNYGGELLADDPDLEAIRSHPDFAIIVRHSELTSSHRNR